MPDNDEEVEQGLIKALGLNHEILIDPDITQYVPPGSGIHLFQKTDDGRVRMGYVCRLCRMIVYTRYEVGTKLQEELAPDYRPITPDTPCQRK